MFKKLLSLLCLSIFIVIAFVPWDLFYESKVTLAGMMQLPNAQHLLGTDNLGRDLLVRLSQSLIGVVFPLWGVVILASAMGVFVSILWRSNRDSPWLSKLLMIFEVKAGLVLSVPISITVFIFAVLIEKNGIFTVAGTLGVIFFLNSFIQVRDLEQLTAKQGHWLAHEAMGGSLLHRQLVYGVFSGWRPAIQGSLASNLRVAIVIEASLSYLGFGVAEPDPSLGNMIASHFDMILKGNFYIVGVIVSTLLLSIIIPDLIFTWRFKRNPLP